ncbi:hypothetical protein ACOSP7_022782 [Xanthoceras sorbifolium]
MELLPLATMPAVDSKDPAPEANSASSCYIRTPRKNTTADNVVDISTDDEVLNEVQFNEEEAENLNSFAAENAVEDEVPKDTESVEDILSDAASID